MANEFCPMPEARLYAQRIDRPDVDFVVAAMFTGNIRDRADRLNASLEKVGLNYMLYHVPSVHRSISTKGGDDIAFCKPNFIHHVMQELQRPILYLDADIVVREFPAKIVEVARGHTNFAIYNWFADPASDRYELVGVPINGVANKDRFIDLHTAWTCPIPASCCAAAPCNFMTIQMARGTYWHPGWAPSIYTLV